MVISVPTEAKYYEKFLEGYDNPTQFVTMARIVDDSMHFEPYRNFSEETKNKFLEYVYAYYCDHDECGLSQNYSTFDVVCWAMTEFADKFEAMSYEEFENAIDGDVELYN